MLKQPDSIPVTHHKIWQIAGPMILANISVPLLGMVDTAVMGHLNRPHFLGAVAVGTLIFSFLFWGFGFLRMATTGLIAQAVGHNDPEHYQQQLLQRTLLFALFIASLLLLFQTPLSHLAFYAMGASDLVTHYGQEYFSIRIWSAPAILANYVILGCLIGLSATRSALILVLTINIVNIALDLLFVIVFDMAVEGVALASVFAEYLGLVVSYRLLKINRIKLLPLMFTFGFQLDYELRHLLKLHGNIFIRTLCLMFSFAFFMAQSAKQGDIVLAANAVLLHFITFMAFFLDGFANATEVITGNAIGNKDKYQLKRGLTYTALWSGVIATLFSFGYYFWGSTIINLLTTIPSVITVANEYLLWLVIAPIIGVWSYLLDGFFIGATRSAEMRNTMIFSTLVCFLPAWYFLQGLGNHGLWLALIIFLASRAVGQACYLPKILSNKYA